MLPRPAIPDDLADQYTLNGEVMVKYLFYNDMACKIRIYEKQEVEAMIESARARSGRFYTTGFCPQEANGVNKPSACGV